MYKNITLVAFISAFTLTACGGGSSTTDPTGTGSSSKALSSSKASSSKSSVASIASSISSASANQETFSSSSIVASSSSSVAPSSSSSIVASVAPSSSSSSVVASVKSSSSSSSLKSSSSSSSVKSSSSSIPSSSSSVKSSSSVVSSSSVSSFPASIYHVRGTFNDWAEGTLMAGTSAGDVYEFCANFLDIDQANGGPRFKIDPNGAWGSDAFPSADYTVAAGWVKISYNSTTKALTAQQNLPLNCGGASSSSSPVVSSSSSSSVAISSSSVKSSSSVAPSSSSVKSSSSIAPSSSSVRSSSSSVAPSSSSVASSSAVPSSSSVASSSSSVASSLAPHFAGQDCATCHVAGGTAANKIFTIAGTVYKAATATAAVNPDATIVILDSQRLNEVIRVKTDANGNFYSTASLGGLALLDLHPRAIGATNTRDMGPAAPTTGSCNFCHNRKEEQEDYETLPIYIK